MVCVVSMGPLAPAGMGSNYNIKGVLFQCFIFLHWQLLKRSHAV